MNAIERLSKNLHRLDPSAKQELIAPLRKDGMWSLDIESNRARLSVHWNARSGFGISSVHSESFSEGADEVIPSLEEAYQRIERLLKGEEQSTPPLPVLLARLREQKGITQQEVASKLGVKQATISGIERRGDVQISTLRKVIGALGGTIEIVARFPEGTYRLALSSTIDESAAPEWMQSPLKRRASDYRSPSSVKFRRLTRSGHLQSAEAKAQRVRSSHSVLEMY